MAGVLARRDPFFSLFGADPFTLIDRVFEPGLNRPVLRRSTLSAREAYAVREKDDLLVNIDVPGVDPEFGIKVSVKDQTLTIHTTRTWAVEMQNEDRNETATFSITLPREVEQDAVAASVAHGVLTVRVKGVYQEVADERSFEVPVAIAGAESKPELEASNS